MRVGCRRGEVADEGVLLGQFLAPQEFYLCRGEAQSSVVQCGVHDMVCVHVFGFVCVVGGVMWCDVV